MIHDGISTFVINTSQLRFCGLKNVDRLRLRMVHNSENRVVVRFGGHDKSSYFLVFVHESVSGCDLEEFAKCRISVVEVSADSVCVSMVANVF